MTESVRVPVELVDDLLAFTIVPVFDAKAVYTTMVSNGYDALKRRLESAIAAAPAEDDELRRLEREIAFRWARKCWADREHQCSPEGWRNGTPLNEIRYLELRGLLERHPDNPNLVRVKDAGE